MGTNGTIILKNTWFWTPINSFGFVCSNSLYGFIQVVSRGFQLVINSSDYVIKE